MAMVDVDGSLPVDTQRKLVGLFYGCLSSGAEPAFMK